MQGLISISLKALLFKQFLKSLNCMLLLLKELVKFLLVSFLKTKTTLFIGICFTTKMLLNDEAFKNYGKNYFSANFRLYYHFILREFKLYDLFEK